MRILQLTLLSCALAAVIATVGRSQVQGSANEPAKQTTPSEQEANARVALEAALTTAGLAADFDAGVLGIPVTVLVREELLEYVLVAPNGQTHESLFATETSASIINAGLLAMGVQRGQNASIVDTDAGKVIVPPSGDGCYLYVGWKEGEETYLHRLEDLIANLETGRSMQRHRWIFLGSRFIEVKGQRQFAADYSGNLISLAYFYEGDTLLTGSLPACESQTAWLPNPWVLPQTGEQVMFIAARERLSVLPPKVAGALPLVQLTSAGDEQKQR